MDGTNRKTILLVEDDPLLAAAEKAALQGHGYRVFVESTGEDALEALEGVDLVLMDIDLGAGWDGTETARRILERRDLPVVFLSGHTETHIVARTEAVTSYGYVVKNSSLAVLDASIKMAFRLFDARKALLENEARQKAAEAQTLRHQHLLQTIIDSVPGTIFAKDLEGRYFVVNELGARKNGYASAQMMGRTNFELLPAETAAAFQRSDEAVMTTGEPVEDEESLEVGGQVRNFLVRKSAWKDHEGRLLGVIGVSHDVTEAAHARQRIQDLLQEKELLLREVHHRIKNNMATIAGLLGLQVSYSQDERVIAALEDARNRVSSMMVLYDKLYQSGGYNDVSVVDYLSSLIDEILGTFPGAGSITVEKNIGDFVLEVKKVQPFGIILNELLTNIMKHAFAGKTKGFIRIAATLHAGVVRLEVHDNGPGIPPSWVSQRSGGFGLTLVEMLTKNLGGTVHFENDGGTRVVVTFPGSEVTTPAAPAPSRP
jgi:PAS domain S-box-containing protein